MTEPVTRSTTPSDPEAQERLARAAEQVCLMVGWTGVDNSERGKALTELWNAWYNEYQLAGGSSAPSAHPELSDERIRELAAQRDATVAATLARIRSGS